MTQSTKTVILAQVFISGMMATLMSGFMSLIYGGYTATFLNNWGHSILIAWPVAFCFSLAVGPLAFKLAHKLQRFLP